MKKNVVLAGLALILASCQNQQKIGFVDNTKLINEYYKKKNFEAEFQVKIDNFNKKADSLQKAIQLEAQLWQTRASKMNQSKAEQEYQALIQKKQMQDYQLGNEEKVLQQQGQVKIDSLIKEVKDFVKSYGDTNGYTFILGANEAGSVLYGEEKSDITTIVLEALNKGNDTESDDKASE